jgi:hypothetical protein
MYYLRNLLKRGAKSVMKSTLKSGLASSHLGRGMTCGSGIDNYLLSLVKGVNLNPKQKRLGTRRSTGGALKFIR